MIRLDDRDIAILKVLAREGRLSKADLARRINLSPTPCWEWLKRLEKAGIIEGYKPKAAPAPAAKTLAAAPQQQQVTLLRSHSL